MRLWQLAKARVWTLAAQTVAQQLQLIWPTLAWPASVPLLAVSAAVNWRLPQAGMLRRVSTQLDVALDELWIVGGELERVAAQRVRARWSDML